MNNTHCSRCGKPYQYVGDVMPSTTTGEVPWCTCPKITGEEYPDSFNIEVTGRAVDALERIADALEEINTNYCAYQERKENEG